ncbi:MAG: efflux RND transporter permease subunit [bacterium]|nr:efflux RND transporter permease subunit [bacterium]
MTLIRQAIRYPVTTTVGVILVVLFGVIALLRIPVQLTPDVEDPVVTVSTAWPGASPSEVEREIVLEQEEQLKSLEGLVKMESESSDGYGNITLTFQVGTGLDAALLRVSNRLEQVPQYPADAEKPVIRTTDLAAGAVGWFVLVPTEDDAYEGDVWTLFDYIEDFVKPEFERVPGISASNVFGGQEREMRVIIDPARLAGAEVTLGQVATALERENRNYSGGDFDEGKRRYVVRTIGEYESAADIEDIVVALRNDVPVYLRDVGRAELSYRKATARVFNKGRPVLAVNAIKEPGSNVFEVMGGLKRAVAEVNTERLGPMGLRLDQVYDETEYIDSAIDLVQQSLFVGGTLAIVVLLLYLRSGSSTLVIATAIPISVIGAFLAMYAFGRTLNVISLAGMAFAVGMVVDNSIVVLENIYRHRQMGKSRADAAFEGAREVWGAVLASTLTTIAVFVPVVFMKEEVGQLFGDIALAISCAVAISLIVSITVIPSMSAKILGRSRLDRGASGYRNLWGGATLARGVSDGVAGVVHRLTGSVVLRLAVVVVFTVGSIGLSWLMLPKTEYLPVGNQNFVFGLMLPPPGYSMDEMTELQNRFTEEVEYLWAHPPNSPGAQALPGGGVDNYFFVALNSLAFMGGKANDALRVKELLPPFRAANTALPGSIFVISQRSLFERGRGKGRTIDIQITGPDLEQLIAIGGRVFGGVMQHLPAAQSRPIPSLDLGNPEVRVRTHRLRAAELGLSNRELGFAVSVLVDGAKASEYRHEGREIDLRLMAEEGFAHRTHLLEQMPIAAPGGKLVTLGSVADLSVTNGPVQINHFERERTITIEVSPDELTPLEAAIDVIETEILAPLRAEGALGGLYQTRLTGTADKLAQTARSIQFNLLLALVITYLLLSALFESFLYPMVIMFSVPLAAFGGFLGIRIINLATFQPLDVLTMLGFIILIGTVVNNAILIVHQSLNHIRGQGMEQREAIREAVRNRMRPIFMSVSTSVLGMLPLVLFPGAGSELYRGLGSVVIGGLLVSTVFTLILVPSLFSLVLDARRAFLAAVAGLLGPAERPDSERQV